MPDFFTQNAKIFAWESADAMSVDDMHKINGQYQNKLHKIERLKIKIVIKIKKWHGDC